jgi:hypothetical protein
VTSFAIRRLAAATLLVTGAACADNVTQAKFKYDVRADGAQPSANSGPTPTLVATTAVGQSSDFTDPPGSYRLGLQYRVAVNGADFTPGADFVTRTMMVTASGAKMSVGLGIGVVPANGTLRLGRKLSVRISRGV